VPAGVTEAVYATLMGWNSIKQGEEYASYDLVISGQATGYPVITLSKMQVQGGAVRYGARPLRAGEVQLASIRQVTSGNLTALWAFSTAA
jgi:hypothetical protein